MTLGIVVAHATLNFFLASLLSDSGAPDSAEDAFRGAKSGLSVVFTARQRGSSTL